MTTRARAIRLIVMAIVVVVPILLLVLPPLLPHRTQFAVWPIGPASPTAGSFARVWTVLTYIGTGVFVLVGGLMVYAVLSFGRSGPITDEEPPQVHGNPRLEIVWTSIPVVIVAVLFAVAVSTLQATAPPRVDASDTVYVNIQGYQWGWKYTFPQLPGLSVPQGDLHLPVRRSLDWRVTSVDVVHDWWVPALDGHLDAWPNHVTRSVIYTSTPGKYYAQCSKFCGLYHWKMHNYVYVESPAAFGQWAVANGAKQADVARLLGGTPGAAPTPAASTAPFATHLGVAFYIFRNDIYNPYLHNAFGPGAPRRVARSTEASVALGSAIREIDQAVAAANGGSGGAARALVAPLTSLRATYQSLQGELAKGVLNKAHVEGANSQTVQFESKASGAGYTIREQAPSYRVPSPT